MHTCNLAIIFGPTVIRSADCDMVSMVADMSHQCKIVELFISQVSLKWSYPESLGFCCSGKGGGEWEFLRALILYNSLPFLEDYL